MFLTELPTRIRFWRRADAIGPDYPWTHWRLHFKSSQRSLCLAKFARFGSDSEFRPGAYAICCSKISIGDGVTIRPQSVLAADPRDGGAGIVIENDVLIGPGVKLFCHDHSHDDPEIPVAHQGYEPSRPIVLESGCWVGADAIILRGVTVGRNAVVGAGSVVTKDVAPGSVVAGNPATVIRDAAASTPRR